LRRSVTRYACCFALLLLLTGCGNWNPSPPDFPTMEDALGARFPQKVTIAHFEPFGKNRALALFHTDLNQGPIAVLLEQTASGRWRESPMGVARQNGDTNLGALSYGRGNLGQIEKKVGKLTSIYPEAHIIYGDVLDPAITWVEPTLYEKDAVPIRANVSHGIWWAVLPWMKYSREFSLRAGDPSGVRFVASLPNQSTGDGNPLTGPLVAYVDKQSGISLQYPERALIRMLAQPNLLTFDFNYGSITIHREPRETNTTLASLVARRIATPSSVKDERIKIVEQDTRSLGGQAVGYVREDGESPAGKRQTAVYLFLTKDQAFQITCGSDPGKSPYPWADMKSLCDRVLDTVTLGS
jgi:hypothetical protein